MSRRIHESPMDFEYTNGIGPLDARSPFAQLSQNSQRIPDMAKKSTLSSVSFPGGGDAMDVDQAQGGFSSNGTPNKSSHTPAFTRTQSTPAKPLPPTPAAFNGLFSTPRRSQENHDDSSAGETPRSPERDDSEAPTPEGGFESKLDKVDNMRFKSLQMPPKSPSPTKLKDRERPPSSERRDSLWGRMKSKWNSPGRGEVPRGDLHGTREHKIRKQRSRDMHHRQLALQRRYSVSDSEQGDDSEMQLTTPVKSPRKGQNRSPRKSDQPLPSDEQRPHWITNLFTFIASHPTVPHILSFYAQLAFNMFLLAGCAYILYCFWAAVQTDIDRKAHEAVAELMSQSFICARNYNENRCQPDTRVPGMQQMCEDWYACKERDVYKVARAKVSAGALAEIFNSFIEPISYKAMIFSAVLIFGCFGISNYAFGIFRDKAATQQHFNNQYWQQPPPTPQRTFSQEGQGGYYGTPWHQQIQGLEPAPSGNFAQIEGRGSPVRKLAYN